MQFVCGFQVGIVVTRHSCDHAEYVAPVERVPCLSSLHFPHVTSLQDESAFVVTALTLEVTYNKIPSFSCIRGDLVFTWAWFQAAGQV